MKSDKLEMLLMALDHKATNESEFEPIGDTQMASLVGGTKPTSNAACTGNNQCGANSSCNGNSSCSGNEACNGNANCSANESCIHH